MVVNGVVALVTVLVVGKVVTTVVEASGNPVLGIGCIVALDDDVGEDVLAFVVARLAVVCIAAVVVAGVVVGPFVTEVVVVLVAFTVFVVVSCRTCVLFVVEVVVTLLSEDTSEVVRDTFATGFAVAALV